MEDTEYVRNFYPRERLILLGCGHVSQPVCQYAADLGFAVTVGQALVLYDGDLVVGGGTISLMPEEK